MDQGKNGAAPGRGPAHDKLAVFLGTWRADGQSYGSPKQHADDPKANAEPWVSTHKAHWHSGEFFLIQDEKAMTGSNPFDTLSVMGVDEDAGGYFASTFENHGFSRRYQVAVQGDSWTFTGASERARVQFSEANRKQAISWEWKRDGRWLPLCDRTAVRID